MHAVKKGEHTGRAHRVIYDHGSDNHGHGLEGANSYPVLSARHAPTEYSRLEGELEVCTADPYHSVGFNDGRYEAGVYDIRAVY